MKRGSSLRFIEWPMPQILASVLGVMSPMEFSSTHLFGGVLHRLDDVHIAGAAAQVARDRLADLLLARVLVAREERAGGHEHSRRAEAALQTVLLGETLLHRVELASLLQSLDRGDARAVGLHRENGAGLDRVAVEVDRARAAVRGVAADMRAGHAEGLPQKVHQQQPRLDFRLARRAVYRDFDLVRGHVSSLLLSAPPSSAPGRSARAPSL